MERYCVAKRKPKRREKPKPQTAIVVSLWFSGLLACPELHCDWSLPNQHSIPFLSLTVISWSVAKCRGSSGVGMGRG